MMRIVVTGAHGFVGRAVCSALVANGEDVVRAVRSSHNSTDIVVGNISSSTYWAPVLTGANVVIHLAARVHMMRDMATDPLAEFLETNCAASLHLARQAHVAGVRRFVFISSIGVNGAATEVGGAFSEMSTIHPHSPYAVSKADAERQLSQFCNEVGMELVIIRPPLVYAYDAPGNFESLLKIVAKGVPLPLRQVRNLRSMVSLENLVDFICLCAHAPAAAHQVFLVADTDSVSTPQLLRYLGEGMSRPVTLLPVPVSLLRIGAAVLRRQATFQQLCGNLEIDSSKAMKMLNWTPPTTISAGLREAGRRFVDEKSI